MTPSPLRLSTLAAALLLGATATAQTPHRPPPWWNVQDESTVSLYWNFNAPFPAGTFPQPTTAVVPTWYSPAVTAGVATPNLQRIPAIGTHSGVLGVLGTGVPVAASLDLTVDNHPYPDWLKIFWVQFDAFEGTAGDIAAKIEQDLVKYGRAVIEEYSEPLGGGWSRVTILCELIPQPDDEGIDWEFLETAGANIGIDDLYVCSKCVKPKPDEDGDALGQVEGQRLNLTILTGGADCRAVAVTEDQATLQRTLWVGARALIPGGPIQVFRLTPAGTQIGPAVALPVSGVQAPLGPTDLAVETIPSGVGVPQQRVHAIVDRRSSGGPIEIHSIDATTLATTVTPLTGFPAPPQPFGLAFDPSGNLGNGTFWVSDLAGFLYEFSRTGAFIGSVQTPVTGCTGLGYDDTLGNFYCFSRTPRPSPSGPVQVNGFEISGYDVGLPNVVPPTGVEFCGDLTLPNPQPGGPRGGLALGFEVYRPTPPVGVFTSELRMACVVEVQSTQFFYEIAGPYKFGWSQFGRCGMRGGPPFLGSSTFEVTLSGVPNAVLAMMFLGFSNTNYLGTPLPVNLAFAGMPETYLSVSPDVNTGFLTPSAPGQFSLLIPIPSTSTLGYAPVFFQWFVLDATVPGLLAGTQAGKTVLYP